MDLLGWFDLAPPPWIVHKLLLVCLAQTMAAYWTCEAIDDRFKNKNMVWKGTQAIFRLAGTTLAPIAMLVSLIRYKLHINLGQYRYIPVFCTSE